MSKQARLNSEMLDDSLTEITTTVQELAAKEDPSIKDVMQCLLQMVLMMQKRHMREDEMYVKVREIDDKLMEHDLQIETQRREVEALKGSMDSVQRKLSSFERSMNLMTQKRIDNDIFISQFPSEPNAINVAQKLLTLSQIPTEEILSAHTIPLSQKSIGPSSTPSSTQPNKKSYAVILSLKSFEAKRKFLATRKTLGPIKLSQLSSIPINKDSTVKAANRYSAFNMRTQRVLNEAKDAKKIVAIRFRNGLFNYKRTEEAPWTVVGTEDEIITA